jgi:NAD+ synthetase
MLAPHFEGRAPDVTEENLQARVRGTVLMALSNKFGSLVLATGNKSELAVGYCTLYGDMNGGLSVVGDCYKGWVRELAADFSRDGEVIPLSTLTKPPSAELAPGQRDEDSLPPYPVLDRILEGLVERHRSPEQLVAEGLEAATVERVARLLDRNEYKRRQAAPILRVTRKAFGSGRRLPLARG